MDQFTPAYLRNLSGSDNFEPRHIDVVSHGQQYSGSMLNLISKSHGGTLTAYEVTDNQVVRSAQSRGIQVVASNHATSHYGSVPRGVVELKHGFEGHHFHAKTGVLNTDQGRVGLVGTGNLTDSMGYGSRPASQYNFFVATKDKGVVKQLDRFFSEIKAGVAPVSQQDLLVSSPADHYTAAARVDRAFANADPKQKLTLGSATLTSQNVVGIVLRQLARGGDVDLGLSGMPVDEKMPGLQRAQDRALKIIQEQARELPGKLRLGTPTRKIHGNFMTQGDLFEVGSARFTASAWGKGDNNQVSTEAMLLARSKQVSKGLVDQAKQLYTFKDADQFKGSMPGMAWDLHFVDMVNTQHFTHNLNVLVPGQMSPEMRTMFRNTMVGYAGAVNKSGVLTSSYLAYKDPRRYYEIRKGHKIFSTTQERNEYAQLMKIQKTWVEERTWGETWGQLGSRGYLSSWLINKAQAFNNSDLMGFIYQVKGNSDLRFQQLYRPKPIQESTVFADTVRGAVDYVEHLEMNMLAFYTASTAYSQLLNFSSNVFRKIPNALGMKLPGASWAKPVSRAALKVLGTPWTASRLLAADVGASLMSRVGHSIDVLIGASGHGSLQMAIDHQIKDLNTMRMTSGQVSQKAMQRAILVNRHNPIMFATGAGIMNEFYANAQNAWTQFWKSPFKKGTGSMVWANLFGKYDSATARVMQRHVAAGVGLSAFKLVSFGLFAVTMLDKMTGYLGEHMGGVDTSDLEAANRILRDAAYELGYHPVQLQRTGNVGVHMTDNPFVNAARVIGALPRAGINGIWALAGNILDGIREKQMREIVGPNIFELGHEMEAAQKAALMGNKGLAEAYLLMSSEGPKLYQDNTFRADMWKSWVFQITPNPMIFTYTWSMSQHRYQGGRSPFSGQSQEIQEFGFTLQGPVTLTIGFSSDMPWQFVRELGKEDQQVQGEKDWTFSFKPGSSLASAVGALAFLHTMDLGWRGVKTASALFMSRVVSPVATHVGFHKLSGSARAVGDSIAESLHHDHRFLANVNKVGRGTKMYMQARIGAFQAAGRLLALPMTLPIQASMITTNVLLGGLEQTKWAYFRAYDFQQLKHMANDPSKLSPLGNLFKAHVDGNLWVGHAARAGIAAELQAYQTVEAFAEKFGYGEFSTLSEADQKTIRSRMKLVNKITHEMRLPGFHNVKGFVFNRQASIITRGVVALTHLGIAGLALGSLYLAMEAGRNAYKTNNLEASMAYNMANRMIAWAASQSAITRKELNNNKKSWAYHFSEAIRYEDAPEMARGILAFVRSGVLLMDPHGWFRNLRAVAAGVGAEAFLFPAAGFFMDDLRYDSIRQLYVPKDRAATGQIPGVGSTLITWATGILKAFQKGFYHPLESNPYMMMGPYGASQKRIDKDRDAWAGWFAQGGVTMFLTSGYAEQFIFKEGWEKRRYQQFKYVQDQAYSPFGLRQLMRDKAIRTGKMYHDDVLGQATTWGLRMELSRRAMMFQWIRHVDARDLIFGARTLTADVGTSYASRAAIRTFREPKNNNEATFNALVKYYAPSVTDANKAPGTLSETEDELQLVQSIVDGRRFADWFGRPYTMTPNNIEANIFQNPMAHLVAVSFMGMFVAKAGAALLDHVGINVPSNVNKLVQTFRGRTLGLQAAAADRTLERLRMATPQARMVQLTGTDLMALRIGTRGAGELFVKGGGVEGSLGFEAASKLPRSEVRLEDVFWTSAELEHGPMRNFYETLNRTHAVAHDMGHIGRLKKASYNQLSSARNALRDLAQSANSLLERSPKLKQLEILKELVDDLSSGEGHLREITDAMARHYEKNGIAKIFDAMELAEIVANEADNISALDRVTAVNELVGRSTSTITKAFEDAGVIHHLGSDKSNVMRNMLKALHIKDGSLKQIADIARIESVASHGRFGVKEIDSGAASILEQPFVREGRMRFDAWVNMGLVQEAGRMGTAGEGFAKAVSGALGEGANISNVLEMMVEGGIENMDSVKLSGRPPTVEEVLRKLGENKVMSPEVVEELIEKRLKDIRAYATLRTGLDMAKKTVVEGLEVQLFGQHKVSLRGAAGSLAGNTIQGFMFFGNDLAELSYYAKLSHDPDIQGAAVNDSYMHVYRAKQKLIGNAFGMLASALTRGRTALKVANWVRGATGFSVEGGVPGLLVGGALFLLDSFLIWGVSLGIDKLTDALKNDPQRVAEGRAMSHPGFLWGTVDKIWNMEVGIYNFMQKRSRQLEEMRLTNKKLGLWENIQDWAINGMWDPVELQRPQGGWFRWLVDIIYRESQSGDRSAVWSPILWKRPGASPSADQKTHGAFFPHSVLWIGNVYDLSRVLGAQQNALQFQAPGAWNRDMLHPTTHGTLAMNLQTGQNKDGTDPLGPGWIRGDFRSQMFHAPTLVTTTGVEAEMRRRGELSTMLLTNVADERVQMGRVVATYPEYDPRSGAGMAADAFLVSVIDPSKFHSIFVQSTYHHPGLAKLDPYPEPTSSGRSRYRGFIVPPVKAPKFNTPKLPKSGNRGRISSADAPNMPRMATAEVKKGPILRALEAAASRNMAKLAAQRAKSQAPIQREYLVVPTVEVAQLRAPDKATDTSRKQTYQGPFTERDIRMTPTGAQIAGERRPDRHDAEIFAFNDTANMGARTWNDTCG